MHHKQHGVVNGGVITLIIGGLAIGGLLLYGSVTGQELPVWPAVVVGVVNLVAAGKVIKDVRRGKRLHQQNLSAADKKMPTGR